MRCWLKKARGICGGPRRPTLQLRSQRVHHLDRAIMLAVGQVLGVEDGGSAALGCVQDQGVPVGDLVPRLDFKGGDDRLRSVDDDLPTQVVFDQLCDVIARQWIRYSATKIYAELLQDLRT